MVDQDLITNKKILKKLFSIFINNPLSSLLRKRKARGKNIVIISLHKLGDAVFTLEAIKNIIFHHRVNIKLLCHPETIDIYRLALTDIEYIPVEHNSFILNGRIAKPEVRRLLRRLNAKIIYDLTGTVKSASMLVNCKGIITGINEEIFHSLYSNFKPIRTSPHITDIYLDAISGHVPVLKNNYTPLYTNLPKKYVLIHPFAGWEAKQWNLEKFIEIAKRLNQFIPVHFTMEKGALSQSLKVDFLNTELKVYETENIPALIEVIKNCCLFIGNDSGPVHIANLLEKPTFTIYGPTNPEFHVPLKGMNRWITKTIHCSPKKGEKLCFTNGGREGCYSYECMNQLSSDEVYAAIVNFLKDLGYEKVN